MFGKIKITDFGKRHFDSKFGGTKITDKTPEEFGVRLNDIISCSQEGEVVGAFKFGGYTISDGYAPFCKLIAIPNFTNAKVGSLPITIENYQYIRHGYSARTESELPVLSRWFQLPLSVPIANYLIVVVYSREQLLKEYNANIEKIKFEGKSFLSSFELEENCLWGVVAILGQTHPGEEPMQPITMMRNSLGVSEGGSGVELDKEKYLSSVEFWTNNAIVKS